MLLARLHPEANASASCMTPRRDFAPNWTTLGGPQRRANCHGGLRFGVEQAARQLFSLSITYFCSAKI